MIKQAATVWNVFLIHLRQAFYHKTAAMAMVAVWGSRIGVTILLYSAVYNIMHTGEVKGLTYEVAIGGMLLGMFFAGFGTREITRQIDTENKAGILTIWVNKPVSYVMLKIVEVVGKSIPTALGLIICSAVFWIGADHFPHIEWSTARVVGAVLVLVLGLIISACVYAMVGLCAVFIQDARPAFMIVDKLMMLFGGTYIPVGFFPRWLRLTGETLPIASTTLITQMFYPDFVENLPRFLVTQLFWLVVVIWGLFLFTRAANQRITVNGG